MPDKDYYIMLSMIETIDKIIRYTRDYKSVEEFYQNDRDFQQKLLERSEKHILLSEKGFCEERSDA